MKLHRINALLTRYWYSTRSDANRMFDAIYFPILGIIVFGFTTLYLSTSLEVPNIVVLLLGGLLLWTVFERVQQDVSIFLLEDFWNKSVANLFTTPVRLSEIFLSLAIVSLMRAFVSLVIMILLAKTVFGFAFSGANPLAFLFLIPLVLLGLALGITVAGLLFRFGPRIQIFAWSVTFLLQPVSAIYYPVSTLPVWLQHVAAWTPLAYAFEGYRLAYTGSVSWELLGIGTTIGIVLVVISYLFFTASVRYSRLTGRITTF